MDRFKFRAWWPWKEMQYDVQDDTYVNSPDGESDCAGLKYAQQTDGAILMQCTGLKDKNGKLIYEGDVLKVYDNEIIKDKLVVKYGVHAVGYDSDLAFTGPALGFYGEGLTADFLGEEKGYLFPGDGFAWHDKDDEYSECNYEVIGNIYENLELLKGEINDKPTKGRHDA